MFGQILVPIDGSQLAERALPYAERLALATKATVHLVRVVDLLPHMTWMPLPSYVAPDTYDGEVRQGRRYLDEVHRRLAASGATVHSEQISGDPAAALLDYERAHGIDLVVISSHGRSGLARFALGSIASRLVRYGSAPVLIARAFGAPTPLTHALVPLDGSAPAEAALGVLTDLIPTLVTEVTLLQAIDGTQQGEGAEAYLNTVAQRLAQAGVTVHQLLAKGDPAEVIINTAGVDKLVVMATHDRGDLARWALGSVADRVVHNSATTVLLVRREGR